MAEKRNEGLLVESVPSQKADHARLLLRKGATQQPAVSLTLWRREPLSAFRTELARRLVVLSALVCLGLSAWIMVAALWVSAAHAVPAAPTEIALKQPDGKTFAAKQYGDEWNNGFEATQGYTIVRDRGTGRWEYAAKSPRGGLVPSGRAVGSKAPPPVGKHLRSDNSALPQAEQLQNPALATPNTGTQRSLVILVQFPDQKSLGSTPAQWNSRFFGATNSVHDYYDEVSYGQLNIAPAAESHGTANDGVVGWLTMSYNHPNTAGNVGEANRLLARDAAKAADPYVDYKAFDSNADGYLSSQELHVTVVVAGYEAAYDSRAGNSVWGHWWWLSGTSEQPTLDGVVFGDGSHGGGYTQFGEWHRDHMATLGTMVHEMGHDLSLPDLYDTDHTSEGVGKWSVMGDPWSGYPLGSWPSHLDAWSKSYEGWLTPQRASGTQAIGQAETNPTAIQLRDNPGGVDWTFNKNSGAGEYFLVENRQRSGYDANLPGCGLLVWHIDETRTSDNSANADETHRLVDLEEADGLNNLDSVGNRGDAGDPYPGSSNNAGFDHTSNPNSKLYGGVAGGVAAENMGGSCSSSMSAWVTDLPPAGDGFAYAQGLSGPSATASATNVNATKDTGEPNHDGNAGGKSVWYQWTPEASGTTTIDTAGSNFDTLLAVYTGSEVSSLSKVASNNDEVPNELRTSKVSFTANAGTTYRIAVDGYNNGAGAAAGTDLRVQLDQTPRAGVIVFASKRVTDTNPEGDFEIFSMSPGGGDLRQLTHDGTDDHDPVISPDGTRIAYTNLNRLCVMNIDGANNSTLSRDVFVSQEDPTWSPDGTKIAFAALTNSTPNVRDIYTLDASPDSIGPPIQLTNTPVNEFDPAFSPDGTKIAYARGAAQDGRGASLSVMKADGTEQRDIRQGTEGMLVRDPAWAPRYGRIAMTVSTGPGLYQIAAIDEDGSDFILLSPAGSDERQPALSPDGTKIAFASGRDRSADNANNTEIYVTDPATPPLTYTRLTFDPAQDSEPHWGELPKGGSGGSPLTQPPDTTITSGPSGSVSATTASFGFSSSATNATFECSLDGATFGACTSPKGYPGLADGEHAFEVRAIGADGNADPTPASRTWTVDTAAPKVTSTVPAANATGVAPGVNVGATFSEAMSASSINANTFKLFRTDLGTTTAVLATVSYNPTTKTATLDPTYNLALGTKYTAIVTTGTKDATGNVLDQDGGLSGSQGKQWVFTVRN